MSRFRATGHGFHNKLPNVQASAADASAKMTDLISGSTIYLYATGVSTSWSLAGSASQTQSRRTFYPQHLVQGNVIVKGIMPNQYQYDRLVEFVESHHHNVLGLRSSNSPIFGTGITGNPFNSLGGANQNAGDVGVEFMLMPEAIDVSWTGSVDEGRQPTIPKGPYRIKEPMHVAGLITEIRAGAQRFVNSPVFEISLKVTRDYREQAYVDARSVKEAMARFEGGLGTGYKPETLTEDDSKDPIDLIDDLIDAGESVVDGIKDVWDDVSGWLT